MWEGIGSESKEKAAEHFVIAAKLNPQDANAFRYLGHYYSKVSVDTQRALKCYQRALTLDPQDSESGVSLILNFSPIFIHSFNFLYCLFMFSCCKIFPTHSSLLILDLIVHKDSTKLYFKTQKCKILYPYRW